MRVVYVCAYELNFLLPLRLNGSFARLRKGRKEEVVLGGNHCSGSHFVVL